MYGSFSEEIIKNHKNDKNKKSKIQNFPKNELNQITILYCIHKKKGIRENTIFKFFTKTLLLYIIKQLKIIVFGFTNNNRKKK